MYYKFWIPKQNIATIHFCEAAQWPIVQKNPNSSRLQTLKYLDDHDSAFLGP